MSYEFEVIGSTKGPHGSPPDLRVWVVNKRNKLLGLANQFRTITQLNLLNDLFLNLEEIVSPCARKISQQLIQRSGWLSRLYISLDEVDLFQVVGQTSPACQ